MKTFWVHQVARTHPGQKPFLDRETSVHFWQRLRAAFPSRVLAACLMPNHLHIIWATGTPEKFRQRLAAQCRAFTRAHFPRKSLWEALPPFDEIHDLQKLETTLRYVHLNPCRARLTANPWSWEFSTLSEHTLSSLKAWVDFAALEQSVSSRLRTFCLESWKVRHAHWVSNDAYVAPDVRQHLLDLPELSDLSFDACVHAFERATSQPAGASLRKNPYRPLLVKLLYASKPGLPMQEVAERLGMSRSTIASILLEPPLSAPHQQAIRLAARNLEVEGMQPSRKMNVADSEAI